MGLSTLQAVDFVPNAIPQGHGTRIDRTDRPSRTDRTDRTGRTDRIDRPEQTARQFQTVQDNQTDRTEHSGEPTIQPSGSGRLSERSTGAGGFLSRSWRLLAALGGIGQPTDAQSLSLTPKMHNSLLYLACSTSEGRLGESASIAARVWMLLPRHDWWAPVERGCPPYCLGALELSSSPL